MTPSKSRTSANPHPTGHRYWMYRIVTATLIGLGASLTLLSGGVSAAEVAEADSLLLNHYNFRQADARSRLPKYLREISGLTADVEEQVLLHHDNNAKIWRFNTGTNKLDESALQPNPVKGDFEGIARLGDVVLMSTSHATLLSFDNSIQTTKDSTLTWGDLPFKGLCNFEGLATYTQADSRITALLPCKYPRFVEAGKPPADDNRLYVFRHTLGDDQSELAPLAIDVSPVLRDFRLPRLRPSAIEVINDRLLILAGKERVLLETTLEGKVLAWRRLRWPRHRQAEGLTLTDDGTLVIADEGRWLGGTITSYRRRKVAE